jgi:hypothetical protein
MLGLPEENSAATNAVAFFTFFTLPSAAKTKCLVTLTPVVEIINILHEYFTALANYAVLLFIACMLPFSVI